MVRLRKLAFRVAYALLRIFPPDRDCLIQHMRLETAQTLRSTASPVAYLYSLPPSNPQKIRKRLTLGPGPNGSCRAHNAGQEDKAGTPQIATAARATYFC